MIGWVITRVERRLLDPAAAPAVKRRNGFLLLALVAGGCALLGVLVTWVLRGVPGGWIVEGALMSTLLAFRSLADHVRAVADGLRQSLAQGRLAVSHVVGRDPEALDEAAVGRAAIETLAENLSDGVVAPLFWGALFGLPGMLAYKAINTLDSMVGHKSERYFDFGFASARCDDLVNLIPARLTGMAIAAFDGAAWRAMRRDAPHHRSPNAGWPESAMAAVLGVRLAGPRRYGGKLVDDGWMGDGRAEVTPDDIDSGIAIAGRAYAVAAGILLGLSHLAR